MDRLKKSLVFTTLLLVSISLADARGFTNVEFCWLANEPAEEVAAYVIYTGKKEVGKYRSKHVIPSNFEEFEDVICTTIRMSKKGYWAKATAFNADGESPYSDTFYIKE